MLTEFRGSSASTYAGCLGSMYVNEHEISGCLAACNALHEVFKLRVSHETWAAQIAVLVVCKRAGLDRQG